MSTPTNSIAANWTALRALAPDRFDAFKRPGDVDELDAIARYVWNIAVCGHLYPVLHAVEITFRNQLHNSLVARYGSTWYDTGGFLKAGERAMVSVAKTTLTRMKRAHDPGRIVAELNFGFWTQLYGKRHEHDVVRPTIRRVFPHYIGSAPLQRAVVDTPLRNIRLLRNRISHHEHIAFDANLAALYTQAVNLVRWMNPQMADIASIDDDFPALYGGTWREYRPIVEQIFV